MQKFKTQPEANVPLDKAKFFKASLRCIFNQTVVTIPLTYTLYNIGLRTMEVIPGARETPTFPKLMFDLVIMGFIYEIGHYYSHRLMHHRLFYKRIHKIHHEWTAPVATMSIYAHWIGLYYSFIIVFFVTNFSLFYNRTYLQQFVAQHTQHHCFKSTIIDELGLAIHGYN